jgi:hypothetical protein
MAGAFNIPLRIPVKRSRWLLSGISLAHGGAVCLLWPVALPVGLKIIFLLMICISFINSMHKHLYFRNNNSPVELFLNDEDEWLLTTRKNGTYEVQLHAEHYVHPWLVVLLFSTEARNHTIILTPDMIHPDVFRRLRVRLRFKKNFK